MISSSYLSKSSSKASSLISSLSESMVMVQGTADSMMKMQAAQKKLSKHIVAKCSTWLRDRDPSCKFRDPHRDNIHQPPK
eukprot:m.1091513 g.1091513  ORF g.1091513 m.1091513 type:complete len:80 (+) comp24288_c0_seq6:6235-6474(+)